MHLPGTEPTQLEVAIQLGDRLDQINKQVEEKEKEIHALKEQYNNIERRLLPELFEELGVQEIVLRDGTKIRLNSFYVGRLTPVNKEEAFHWLSDRNLDSIVKNKIDISLERGSQDTLRVIKAFCEENAIPFNLKEDIHHATLKSFINEQMENPDFPKELFNVHEVKQVRFVS